MSKSPAFQWYPKDILASARVQMMSLAEECAYRRLIDFCWINGSVPADASRAARLVGKGCTPEVAKIALEMFAPHPDDSKKMIHDRLEVERSKQEHNSEARKKASEARWNKQGTSNENGKSGKPADVRGKRDEAVHSNGKQVTSKSNAIALQTESIAIATTCTNTFSNEKDIGRNGDPPKRPPTENQNEYLDRKQREYPNLEVRECYQRYFNYCKKLGNSPKRPFFDNWLANEYEPMTAAFENKSDLPTAEEVEKQREKFRQTQKLGNPAM